MIAALKRRDEDPAYFIGTMLGAIAIGLVVAAIGRVVFVRSGSVGSRLRSPWLPFIAAAISWTAVLNTPAEHGRAVPRDLRAIEHCKEDPGALLDRVRPTRGMIFERAEPALERAVLASFPTTVRMHLVVRLTMRHQKRVGYALAIPGSDRVVNELAAGLVEGARARDSTAKRRTVDLDVSKAEEVRWSENGHPTLVMVFKSGCVAVALFGPDSRTVRALVGAVQLAE